MTPIDRLGTVISHPSGLNPDRLIRRQWDDLSFSHKHGTPTPFQINLISSTKNCDIGVYQMYYVGIDIGKNGSLHGRHRWTRNVYLKALDV